MDLALSTLLDFFIVAILAVSIVLGVRNGLIRSIINLVGNVAALILALIFSAQLGVYVDANYVNAPLREWAINQLTASVEQISATEIDFDDLLENRPEFFTETCEFLGVDVDEIQKSYEILKSDGMDQAKSAIITQMVDPLSSVISRVIAFAVIYLAATLAIAVITLFSRFLTNLPIIRHMDKLGGGILGAVTGVLITFIFVAIVSTGSKYLLRDRTPAERDAIRSNTVVYKVVHEINPLNNLFHTTDPAEE